MMPYYVFLQLHLMVPQLTFINVTWKQALKLCAPAASFILKKFFPSEFITAAKCEMWW